MKLICKKEAIENGVKVMQFTKGVEYKAYINDSDDDIVYEVIDDNGQKEEFYNIDVMFKKLSQ